MTTPNTDSCLHACQAAQRPKRSTQASQQSETRSASLISLTCSSVLGASGVEDRRTDQWTDRQTDKDRDKAGGSGSKRGSEPVSEAGRERDFSQDLPVPSGPSASPRETTEDCVHHPWSSPTHRAHHITNNCPSVARATHLPHFHGGVDFVFCGGSAMLDQESKILKAVAPVEARK